MEIKVMNRKQVEELFSFHKEPKEVNILSISDTLAEIPQIHTKGKILFLKFDDIPDIKYQDKLSPHAFSEEDALEIIKFIKKIYDSKLLLIVHCHAGVSRSAAVAAALKRILKQDPNDIYGSVNYTPNDYVYEILVKKFLDSKDYFDENYLLNFSPFDYNKFKEMKELNIKVWKKRWNKLDN